jgi:hypothetical protein
LEKLQLQQKIFKQQAHRLHIFEELVNVLKHSKNGRATEEDEINTVLFKYTGQDFQYRFLYFLSMVWQGETPPESWQKSLVIPLHKKGDLKKCENYRGISLLNSGYKNYKEQTQ